MLVKIVFILIMPLFIYARTLTFAAIDLPPYVYFENGIAKGFNVEILNAIFKRLNIEIKYENFPWARAIILLKQGKIDALFPMLITQERLKFVDYTKSFTSEPFAMFIRKNTHITYDGNLQKLSSYMFGRVRGYSSGEFFDNAVKSGYIQLTESIDSEQNLTKFFKNRFDILVDNQYYIMYKLKRLQKSNDVIMLKPLLDNNLSYLGFSKKREHKELIEEFNKVLTQIKEDGTYDAIIRNYFKD